MMAEFCRHSDTLSPLSGCARCKGTSTPIDSYSLEALEHWLTYVSSSSHKSGLKDRTWRAHISPTPRKTRRSSHVSPARASLSYDAKSDIQKMVKAALKPAYARKDIDTNQYTEINREISRMMYEKVGNMDHLVDGEKRDRWTTLASYEVEKAIKAIRQHTGVEQI